MIEDERGEWVYANDAQAEIEKRDNEIKRLEGEIAELKGESASWEKAFNIEWERLERLTTLINDDERAKELGDEFSIASTAIEAINDYRVMLREEIEEGKQHTKVFNAINATAKISAVKP